jgi:hypothetical protein
MEELEKAIQLEPRCSNVSMSAAQSIGTGEPGEGHRLAMRYNPIYKKCWEFRAELDQLRREKTRREWLGK